MSFEEWYSIPGFENYQVSQFGNVRNRSTKKLLRRFWSGPKDRQRLCVGLYRNGKIWQKSVAVLVADAFLSSKPSPRHHLTFKDGDKSNVIADNLRWIRKTQYNRFLRKKGKGRLLPVDDRPVRVIQTGEVFPNVAALSYRIGVSKTKLFKILNGNIQHDDWFVIEWAD